MPVTNPIALPAIAFSKNLLNLVLQSDDYLDAAAVKSVNFLKFAGAIAEDDAFTLTWNNGAASMTAKDAPDDSGLQFPSGDGSDAYVTSLLDWFGSNPFIAGAYVLSTDFTGPDPMIVFTAISFGPDYDFTTFNAGASGVTTGGVTDQPKSNFAHHLELWIAAADGSAFMQAISANFALDVPVTGKTTTDIHDHLDAFLSSDLPELVELSAFCLNSIRPYYFLYAQFYGDTPFVRRLKKSATYVISKGGLSIQASAARTLLTELIPPTLTEGRSRFLRQGSINKAISPEQPEWITWINLTGATKNINLQVSVTCLDDADNFEFNSVSEIAVAALKKIQFQVGYTQLGIKARTDGTPVSYTVEVIDNDTGDGLTQAYAFVIDNQYRPYARYFVYENAYGAFQTIGTVGKCLDEYDRTKDDAQMAVGQDKAAIDGEFLESNVLIQDKATASIGYDRSGKRNTKLLRDFILSRKRFLAVPAVGEGLITLVPIGINDTNLKDAADGVNVYANSFSYYPLYPEEVYTEDAGLEDDSVDDLLGAAGSPVPPPTSLPGGSGDVIVVEFGDIHLSVDGDGHQVYTAAALIGLEGYRVFSTQMANYFRTSELSYDDVAGSFTVLIDGFVLANGEQLNIFPYVINPDD
jgi:hypothetical protein